MPDLINKRLNRLASLIFVDFVGLYFYPDPLNLVKNALTSSVYFLKRLDWKPFNRISKKVINKAKIQRLP